MSPVAEKEPYWNVRNTYVLTVIWHSKQSFAISPIPNPLCTDTNIHKDVKDNVVNIYTLTHTRQTPETQDTMQGKQEQTISIENKQTHTDTHTHRHTDTDTHRHTHTHTNHNPLKQRKQFPQKQTLTVKSLSFRDPLGQENGKRQCYASTV